MYNDNNVEQPVDFFFHRLLNIIVVLDISSF